MIRAPKECISSELDPPLNYLLIVDDAGLEKLKDFFRRVDVFGFDVETNMTRTHYDRRIRTLQFGNRFEQYVIDLLYWAQRIPARDVQDAFMGGLGNYSHHPAFQSVVGAIKEPLENPRWQKVGHNLAFDYMCAKWCFGVQMCGVFDTYISEQLLYAGADKFDQRGRWGLKDLCLKYLKLIISKEEQTGFDLITPLTQSQVEYAALDPRLSLALAAPLQKGIEKAGLERVAKIEFEALPAFGDMQLNGLNLNLGKWEALLDESEKERIEVIGKLDEIFIPVVGIKSVPSYDLKLLEDTWRSSPCKTKEEKALKAERRREFYARRQETNQAIKHFKECEGEADLNYQAPAQLRDALWKTGNYNPKNLPSTDDRILERFVGDATIKLIQRFRELNTIKKRYGKSFTRTIHPQTGRIHSRINQIGAATGRPSSKGPNVFNIMRDRDWRGCFEASPGKVLVTIDCAGQELRIACEISQEPIMVDAFKKHWDVHSVGAEIIFEEWSKGAVDGCAYLEKHLKCKCAEHKELRERIKAINFGIIFGMEAEKLADELKIPLEEARVLLNKKYKGTFKVLIAALERWGNDAVMNQEARTILGRRRLFPRPEWDDIKKMIYMDRVKKYFGAQALKKGIYDKTDKRLYISSSNIGFKLKTMTEAIKREGKNLPSQGGGADMMKLAMGAGTCPEGKPYMWPTIETKYGAKLVNFVYDEFVLEVDEDKAQEVFEFVSDCIIRAGGEMIKSIPVEVEGNIAKEWKK